MRLLCARRPVDSVIAASETDPALRAQLKSIDRARSHAENLGLSVDEQYTDYVAWPGDRVITTLVVTEPGQVEARPFEFPLVGALPYKGFFDFARAERAAASFRQDGLDVCLVPVPAYSTLGFFSDPITDPMLQGGEGRAVETVLHEFVHATFFVDGDAGLNESAASFIGQEASVQFYTGDAPKQKQRREEVTDSRLVAAEILRFQKRVRDLYATSAKPDDPSVRTQRAVEESRARDRISALPLSRRDPKRTAERVRLNDACLALRGTYSADIPQHERLFNEMNGDLSALIQRLRESAGSQDPRSTFFGISNPPEGPD